MWPQSYASRARSSYEEQSSRGLGTPCQWTANEPNHQMAPPNVKQEIQTSQGEASGSLAHAPFVSSAQSTMPLSSFHYNQDVSMMDRSVQPTRRSRAIPYENVSNGSPFHQVDSAFAMGTFEIHKPGQPTAAWWDETHAPQNGQMANTNPVFHDGLPGQWPPVSVVSPTWSHHSHDNMGLKTISPRELTLNAPPLSMSSAESNNELSSPSVDSNDDQDYASQPDLSSQNRYLPMSPQARSPQDHSIQASLDEPVTHQEVPVLPSNDRRAPRAKKIRKRAMRRKSPQNCSITEDHPPYDQEAAEPLAVQSSPLRPLEQRKLPEASSGSPIPLFVNRIPPEARGGSPIPMIVNRIPSPMVIPPRLDSERAAKDEYLVRAKNSGMSYKEIREKGGFTEAESTLRGRYRTLTKHKSARVRRPEWKQQDVCAARTNHVLC